METGLAGVTGTPPPVSSKLWGRKRDAKATVLRDSRDAPFRSVGRRLSGLGASSRSPVRPVRSLRTRISAKYLLQTAAVFFPSNYTRLGPTQMFPSRWVSART